MSNYKKKNNRKKASGEKDTFAKKHWEAFEELSLRIVEDFYHERPSIRSRLTASQNDGGYDGILCFPVHNTNAAELYKVLMEAKLRSSSNNNLPLSDFSKSIIIAVNTIADKIYISTNAYFSAETGVRLRLYRQRTGLQISLIDIEYIVDWLNDHPKDASTFRDQELIQTLIAMRRHLSPERRTLLPRPDEAEKIMPSQLIGDRRKAALLHATEVLRIKNGVLCIQAEYGAGKTVFIYNLSETLRSDYKHIEELDLTKLTDARSVFIHLLSYAWGQSATDIFAMSLDDLREVTEYLGDDLFPERSRAALIDMIHQPQAEFDKRRNLHTELLLDYMKKIFPPIIRRIRGLIIIKSIKHATQNALDFLCCFIKILEGQPISFIIEIEEQQENCSYFLSELKQTPAYIETIILPQWDYTAAHLFLSQIAPELSDRDRDKLIHYFGYLPMALEAGARDFLHSPVGQALPILSIENTRELTIARDKYILGCIDYIVEKYAARGPEYQCSLVLLGLFDGAVDIELLEEMAVALRLPSPVPSVCMCSFMQKVRRENRTEIRVLHDVYTNSIKRQQFITRPFLYQVLTLAETMLERYFKDTEYIQRKRFDIFASTKDFQQLCKIWKPLVAGYMQRGEKQLAHHVASVVYDLWMSAPTENRVDLYDQYWLLFHLVDTTYSLYGAEEQALQRYQAQLDVVANTAEEKAWPKGAYDLQLARARILSIKSQVSLGKADYAQMLSYADSGIGFIKDTSDPRSCRLLGALWSDKALAIKHLYNSQKAMDFMEFGKEKLWGVQTFMYNYFIHLSGLYSDKDPQKALECFEKAKKECSDSLSEQLHLDHNIATMHFLLGQYDTAAKISGQVWISAYENHIPIEEGRSDHLLACIEWVKGNHAVARDHFVAACQKFETYVHRTHTWPPMINLSTLCKEMGQKDEAIAHATKAARFLLDYHLESINHLDLSSGSIPKFYVGILILLDHFVRFNEGLEIRDELLEKITSPSIILAYKKYIIPNRLDELLEGTIYICGGKRMLKV